MLVPARHPFGAGALVIDIVNVIGSGRVGSAVSARLRERGVDIRADGAWAAVTAATADARAVAMWLTETLGLRPFDLADDARTLYHAGAVFASNYVVTMQRAAALLFRAAGAPAEALEPLMERTIENGFELTGPISRGDWATVDAHLAEIRARTPELDHLYETLAGATLALAT